MRRVCFSHTISSKYWLFCTRKIFCSMKGILLLLFNCFCSLSSDYPSSLCYSGIWDVQCCGCYSQSWDGVLSHYNDQSFLQGISSNLLNVRNYYWEWKIQFLLFLVFLLLIFVFVFPFIFIDQLIKLIYSL